MDTCLVGNIRAARARMNYAKWASIVDEDDERPSAAQHDAYVTPSGALAPDAQRGFLENLTGHAVNHLSAGDPLRVCCATLEEHSRSNGDALVLRFEFPGCLPPRWRSPGQQQRLAFHETGARECVAEILGDLPLTVMSRAALLQACGHPADHPQYIQLDQDLQPQPGTFLLVAQLATEAEGWMRMHRLPYAKASVRRVVGAAKSGPERIEPVGTDEEPSVATCGGAMRIVGLVKAAQHNGKVGRILDRKGEEGRIGVQLDDGQVLSVRPENLEAV